METNRSFYAGSESSNEHTQLANRTRDVALRLKLLIVPYEPPHDKPNKMSCAPNEDSDQPGHPPILIRVFAVPWMGSFLHAESEEWSDWADAQADLSSLGAPAIFFWFCHDMAQVLSERTVNIPVLSWAIVVCLCDKYQFNWHKFCSLTCFFVYEVNVTFCPLGIQ